MKTNIKGLTRAQLEVLAQSLGERKFRGAQIFSWLYGKMVSSFDEMSDLSREFRELLDQSTELRHLTVRTSKVSVDGTTKYLFGLFDGRSIETVLIPPDPSSPNADKRLTLCVSSQVGCPLDCKFCATGTMGFTRNLEVGEIVDQVLHVQRSSSRRITNVVLMGMGEPMLNYENVMAAIEILSDDRGLNIGMKHITVSTAGYVDKIRRMADEGRKMKLAVSLHSLDNEKRTLIMPISKKYPVDALVEGLEYYYKKTRQRTTLEYIVFAGFNDTSEDVRRLTRLSKRIPCKVNLIPYHSIDFAAPAGGSIALRPAPAERIDEFANELRANSITVLVRSSSGKDINAACGQLAVSETTRI